MTDTKEKLTQKEVNAHISEHIKKAKEHIKKAEEIADKYNEGFYWGLAYGMGGYYLPKDERNEDGPDRYSDEKYPYESGEWHSSSQGC